MVKKPLPLVMCCVERTQNSSELIEEEFRLHNLEGKFLASGRTASELAERYILGGDYYSNQEIITIPRRKIIDHPILGQYRILPATILYRLAFRDQCNYLSERIRNL